MSMKRDWVVLGSELSPFTLKLLAMCHYKGLDCRHLPEEGNWLENVRINLRKQRLVQGRLPLTYPQFTGEDEFPLVPFLFGPQGENLYDSTAIGEWLDQHFARLALIPLDPALDFCVRLLDEFADEWMLYLVHHYRWKVSAADNTAGMRLARELRTLTFGLRRPVSEFFSARQVRRLPYLFSIAPTGYAMPGLPARRQPPSRTGFPPTHALLEGSYRRILLALEGIFTQQAYLFGKIPTLADFSVYGQIGMNLPDPSANRFIEQTAAYAHQWVTRMHRHEFGSAVTPDFALRPLLAPLLAEVCRVYVPLMQQNARAYEKFRAKGETQFNERAFNAGRNLYDGQIDGMSFRSVAKSFQARTWRRLCQAWTALDQTQRDRLEALLPQSHGLGQYLAEGQEQGR
jgi:glutathione S-transferase